MDKIRREIIFLLVISLCFVAVAFIFTAGSCPICPSAYSIAKQIEKDYCDKLYKGTNTKWYVSKDGKTTALFCVNKRSGFSKLVAKPRCNRYAPPEKCSYNKDQIHIKKQHPIPASAFRR